MCLCVRFFRAYNPLINNGLHIFGAHTCFLCVLSVEKCVFVLLGSLQYRYFLYLLSFPILAAAFSMHGRHGTRNLTRYSVYTGPDILVSKRPGGFVN